MSGDYSRLIAWPFLRHLIGRSQDRRATPLRSSAATSDKHRGLGAAQHPVPGQTGLEFAHWCCMRWEHELRCAALVGNLKSAPTTVALPVVHMARAVGIKVSILSTSSGSMRSKRG